MMIGRDRQLYIIDFNRSDFGDPWEEFNRIVWCAQAAPVFARAWSTAILTARSRWRFGGCWRFISAATRLAPSPGRFLWRKGNPRHARPGQNGTAMVRRHEKPGAQLVYAGFMTPGQLFRHKNPGIYISLDFLAPCPGFRLYPAAGVLVAGSAMPTES
jgi:hypothetical protein